MQKNICHANIAIMTVTKCFSNANRKYNRTEWIATQRSFNKLRKSSLTFKKIIRFEFY